MKSIPRCMSTQHPDNVATPFFAQDAVLGGEDEIQEAYYSFSHLGCDEQMWDCEGKEVDSFVVKKLLTKYEIFFKENKLGEEVYITLRIPNPTVEKTEAKVLLETLESIPRSFDAAQLFYGQPITPIFEVILPMTASHQSLDRIFRYYRDFVVGKQNKPVGKGDITIAEWIGDFFPKTINVIPLFEDWHGFLNAHNIVKKYLADKKVPYQRVFLARSDPAMNYGIVNAVLLNKIALQRLHRLSNRMDIPFYSIVGAGSAPFRGNLTPNHVAQVDKEYPSVHTFTIQSAFKYDHAASEVTAGIKYLRNRTTSEPHFLDEKRALRLMHKYCREYQGQLATLAPAINEMAKFVPGRRKRKLHIGLFGYSRNLGKLALPRVITFTAALYSLGIPPEILGLTALNKDDLKWLKETYIHFEDDLRDAARFLNPASSLLPKGIKKKLLSLLDGFHINSDHVSLSEHMTQAIRRKRTEGLGELLLQAAYLRKFLG